MFPRLYSANRRTLEQLALHTVCACYYYDLADCIVEMSDEELEAIIATDGVDCANCG